MSIADVVKKYVDSYGFDALADERRFSSFVDDMVSENGVEKNIVKQALNAGIYERFLSKAESGDKTAIANAAVDYLQKNLGITEEWAAFAAQVFADALGWGITVERKPKSAPEPPPAPAPSQPTPAPKPTSAPEPAQPTPTPTPSPRPTSTPTPTPAPPPVFEQPQNNNVGQSGARQMRNNRMAVLGFICSLVSIIACFTWIYGIAGFVCSIIGLVQINNGNGKGKKLAVAGIVLSSFGLLLSILSLAGSA